jgi:hypothetical protein
MTGSGKSTIARALERRLFDRGRTLLRLDGESLRLGISRDLGIQRRGALRASAPGRRDRPARERAGAARDRRGAGASRVGARAHPRPDRRPALRRGVPRRTRGGPPRPRPARALRGGRPGRDRPPSRGHQRLRAAAAPDLKIDTSAATVDESVDRIIALLAERGFVAPLTTGELRWAARTQRLPHRRPRVGRRPAGAARPRRRRPCGSPACPARASPRSPTRSSARSSTAASPRSCSTATTCATGSTATSASRPPTARRTSAASARSAG